MLAEDHVVVQMDHVHDVLRVILFKELENFELNTSLIDVLLLILDDLNRNIDASLVIEAFQGRSKRAFTEE